MQISCVSFVLVIFCLIAHSKGQTTGSCESVIAAGVQIDGAPVSFYWMDSASQRGLLLTENSKVYLTTTFGKTWSPITFSTQDEKNQTHAVRAISQSSSDLATVYVLSDDRFWLTEDAAVTWSTEKFPSSKDWDFLPHPTKPHWILGTYWNTLLPSCSWLPTRTTCYRELSVSYDSGKTWLVVDQYVSSWLWSSGDEILYSSWDTNSQNQLYKNSADLMLQATRYVNNAFQTRLILDTGAVDFTFLRKTQTLWVAKKISQQSTLSLYSSTNIGTTLNIVYFGSQEVQQNRYTVYESPEGDSVFIVLESPDSDEWGNLYRSDSTFQYFTLVLPYVIKRDLHDPDLAEFAGLPGIYLANHYNMTGKQSVIESHISFASGTTWDYIAPPASYQVGPNKCAPPCGLQIDMESDALPLSYSSAPGLMLAVGNIGNYLTTGTNQGLFFTREAGTVWESVRTDRWDLYQMGDYGNLLLAAQSGQNDVAFSLDQGLTWIECIVTTDLHIENLWAVPNKPFLFLMLLTSTSVVLPANQLVWLNFSELHERECEGFDSPDTADSDYETWVPPVNADKCVMGQRETYIRRKQSAPCFVPEGDAIKSVTPCPCTIEDYECDYCHIRDPQNQTCVYYCEEASQDLEAFCGDGQKYYNKSQGYRKIAGNVCTGVTQYDPVVTQCPTTITTGTTGSTGSTGSTGTTGSAGTSGSTSGWGTTSSPVQTTSANDQAGSNDDEDMTPVIILAAIVGSATLIGLALLVAWLIQARNKPVPDELRDVGEANRLYDRT